MARQHLRTPEQALMGKHWDEVNRHSWRLRRMTGGQLKLAMLMSVPEGLRPEVEQRVLELQAKHNKVNHGR